MIWSCGQTNIRVPIYMHTFGKATLLNQVCSRSMFGFKKFILTKCHMLFLATASYRLLTDITLTKPVTGMMAHRLKKCFPDGVIGIKSEEGL